MTVYDSPWQSMTVHDSPWQSMTVNDSPWQSIIVHVSQITTVSHFRLVLKNSWPSSPTSSMGTMALVRYRRPLCLCICALFMLTALKIRESTLGILSSKETVGEGPIFLTIKKVRGKSFMRGTRKKTYRRWRVKFCRRQIYSSSLRLFQITWMIF